MNYKVLAFIYNRKLKKFFIFKTNGEEPEKHGESKWYTITGSVEESESHEEAVEREVLEETGLTVKDIYSLKWGCRYNWQGKTHEELYFLAFVDSDKVKLDKIELIDYKLLDLDKFVELLDWNLDKEELKIILQKGLNRKIDSLSNRIDDYI